MGNKKAKDETIKEEESQPKNLSLQYSGASQSSMGDSDENDADFIKDIQQFKKDLPIIHVPKVQLAQL